MSGTNSITPPSGVVRNSALSFVATAQPPMNLPDQPGIVQDSESRERLVPAGLKALCNAYSRLYPDQPNPLQVTTRLKYWLGGQDPLDYISMYWNPGKPEEHIPPHWHYVSFGLSDLHGDGRVHAVGANESGLGLELSLRLAANVPGPSGTSGALGAVNPGSSIAAPPLWPAALLQALARYLLITGNKFCAGDHISWHAPLDGDSGSRVRHLLVVEDPQLPTIHTPHGTVHFVQMVGCTSRELKAAQRGSGFEVLKLIAEDPRCGGAWWVTRAGRRRSARGVLRPRRAASGPAAPAAPLAGVSAKLRWLPLTPDSEELTASPGNLSPSVEQQIKDTLQRGLSCMGSSTERTDPEDSFEMSSMERALPHIPDLMQGSWCSDDTIEYLDGVHLILNAEGASLLPLAIDGRLAHGRHFTWRGAGAAATLVPCGVPAALPSLARPYVQRGAWLQVHCILCCTGTRRVFLAASAQLTCPPPCPASRGPTCSVEPGCRYIVYCAVLEHDACSLQRALSSRARRPAQPRAALRAAWSLVTGTLYTVLYWNTTRVPCSERSAHVPAALPSLARPYVQRGAWLQVHCILCCTGTRRVFLAASAQLTCPPPCPASRGPTCSVEPGYRYIVYCAVLEHDACSLQRALSLRGRRPAQPRAALRAAGSLVTGTLYTVLYWNTTRVPCSERSAHVAAALPSLARPYAQWGAWLQVHCILCCTGTRRVFLAASAQLTWPPPCPASRGPTRSGEPGCRYIVYRAVLEHDACSLQRALSSRGRRPAQPRAALRAVGSLAAGTLYTVLYWNTTRVPCSERSAHVAAALPSLARPYAQWGAWLQVHCILCCTGTRRVFLAASAQLTWPPPCPASRGPTRSGEPGCRYIVYCAVLEHDACSLQRALSSRGRRPAQPRVALRAVGSLAAGTLYTVLYWNTTRVPCSERSAHVAAALPSLSRPYAQWGAWLQVLIPEQLAREMSPQVAPLASLAPVDSESDAESESEGEPQPPKLPLALHWPRYRLKITVLPDHELF
ncbi:unnamed protein product [Parnassius apollo]|uniref:(apollo) hypothetical protein n=1 Tax=Parnassius apollo TaxID=110799 RepID=A0A8S3W2C2_PARAO|nr:unnamed protein product [Parnassius apollo]